MDFNQLMARMRELDAPVQAAPQSAVQECGDPMGMPSPMPSSMNTQPPPAHPSMTVNLNAQGMDSIESLLKLMTKVNPDMINQPMPAMPPMPGLSSEPSMISIKPELPPLKMLPDFDKEPHSEPDADNMGGPSDNDADNMPPMGDLDSDDNGIDAIQKSMGDNDGDGDHDMDDHDMEKKEKDEAFGNSLNGSESDYKDIGAAIPSGNDLNKPKSTFPKVAGGDNPMQRTQTKEALRASIRAELLSRLNEVKGAK
jgi:hypothetical protein